MSGQDFHKEIYLKKVYGNEQRLFICNDIWFFMVNSKNIGSEINKPIQNGVKRH